MDKFDVSNLLNKINNYQQIMNARNNTQKAAQTFSENFTPTPITEAVAKETANENVQMNTLKSIDMSVYAKEVMKLPKNLNEFIYMIQKGLTQAQFNSMFARQITAQRNALSQTQAQILAQLQGLSTPTQIQTLIQTQMASQLQATIKNLTLSPNGTINLTNIAKMLHLNGKEALTTLITAMTQASKQGVNDLSQIKDMAKLINASIALASQNNPAQTLKALLMLYLPWLPLEEGVGFDLEVETKEEKEESDSILTITITTKNYGKVVATLLLETKNSVAVNVECSKDFPKDELMLRIAGEQTHYSMESVLTFSEKEARNEGTQGRATVNMSQTTEINPYMLMMAHMIIRHVIEIDNNGVKN